MDIEKERAAFEADFRKRNSIPDYIDFASMNPYVASEAWAAWQAATSRAAIATQEAAPKLQVWYGAMPESNGKSNFTAILHKGDITDGITLDRSEYPDRVRYEADRARYVIGELAERPWILDYDDKKHSGYIAPQPAPAPAVAVDARRRNGEPLWSGNAETVTMTGHQLREALGFINPDGADEPDQLDDDLTFGIVRHADDDGKESTGLCCWNGDSDGVYPLHGDGAYAAQPTQAPAREPVKLAVGVLATEEGAYLSIQQKSGDATTLLYSQRHRIGESMGTFSIATPFANAGQDA